MERLPRWAQSAGARLLRLSPRASFLAAAITWCSASSFAWTLVGTSFRVENSSTRSSRCLFRAAHGGSGIALTTVLRKRLIGRYLEPMGLKSRLHRLGVTLALH